MIARSLGKCGIICMEDLIQEICTVGKRFKEANNFLWSFKLSFPRGRMKKNTTHFVEGGDAGNGKPEQAYQKDGLRYPTVIFIVSSVNKQ